MKNTDNWDVPENGTLKGNSMLRRIQSKLKKNA